MGPPLTVLLLTHYFPPEVGAAQSRLGFLVRALLRRGHRVEVLTSFPSYPSGVISSAYGGRVLVREPWEGARVTRTWTYARPGHSLLRRIANQCSFALSCVLALPSLPRLDVVLVESPPIFLALSGVLFKMLKRTRLVIHVADLWVKALADFGYLARGSRLYQALRALERLTYRFADALIVVAPGMIEHLPPRACPVAKIHVIPNGVDTAIFSPRRNGDAVRRQLQLEGKFLALFAGTHGHVTDTEILIKVARRLLPFRDIHFLFVGDGVRKQSLVRLAREAELPNVTFLDPQPETRLAEIINASDVGLNSLEPVDFNEHVISVKVFTYMACGIPVVTTDKQALREIVSTSGAGLLVKQGDPGAFADAILELYRHPEKRRALGEEGARWVTTAFSRQIAAERTERLFWDLAEKGC
jgi:colanic acid biosynthesis glycosyl transferase WcaI